MIRTLRVMLLALLATGMVAFLAAPPSTAAKPVKPDQAMAAALQDVANGTWDQADLNLIRSDPTVASQVPDPSVPAEITITEGVAPSKDAVVSAALANSCGHWVYVDLTKKSSLGNTIFKWRHYVQYCRNGSAVTSWQTRTDYLLEAQSGVYLRDEGSTFWQTGIGTSKATSFRQRHIEYCIIRYGCYQNLYPWSKIWVYGGGGYGWDSGGL